jgi:hypothetical protein
LAAFAVDTGLLSGGARSAIGIAGARGRTLGFLAAFAIDAVVISSSAIGTVVVIGAALWTIRSFFARASVAILFVIGTASTIVIGGATRRTCLISYGAFIIDAIIFAIGTLTTIDVIATRIWACGFFFYAFTRFITSLLADVIFAFRFAIAVFGTFIRWSTSEIKHTTQQNQKAPF